MANKTYSSELIVVTLQNQLPPLLCGTRWLVNPLLSAFLCAPGGATQPTERAAYAEGLDFQESISMRDANIRR